jgi:hypothetical protein
MTFPSSTIFNHRIPKTKFYENLDIDSTIKRLFINQIDTIIWQNKLSASTLNVEKGELVEEIEVFLITLNQAEINTKILRIIDENIPYHILFLLKYEDTIKIAIAYKEMSAGQGLNKVLRYFITDSQPENEAGVSLSGLSMDALYENLIRQIAGDKLPWKDGDSLREVVLRAEKWEEIDKHIAILQGKMHNEKQFNRQVELHEEIKRLMREKGEFVNVYKNVFLSGVNLC